MEPSREPPCGRAPKHTMISRVPFPNCRSGVIGLAIAGNPENDVHLSPWQLPASKVGSCVDRQRTHMRTYQKHVGLSMLSFLSCVSLPIPCQALGREKTFPAIVRGITRKMLILQESAPEIEKFSLLFPVGRENADRTHAVHARLARKPGIAPTLPCRAQQERAASFPRAGHLHLQTRPANKAGLPTAVPRRSSLVPPASTSSSPRSCSGTPPTSPTPSPISVRLNNRCPMHGSPIHRRSAGSTSASGLVTPSLGFDFLP
jgi:hypothetical protein